MMLPFRTIRRHASRPAVGGRQWAIALLLALVTAIALGACASPDSVKQAKGQGAKRSFRYPADAVVQAPLLLSGNGKPPVVEQDRAAGLSVLSSSGGVTGLGERIAVFVTQAGERQTVVEIVSKAVGGPITFPPDWPALLFGDLDVELTSSKFK